MSVLRAMRFTNVHYQQLQGALISAFPTRHDLRQMVRLGLDLSLGDIAQDGAALHECVFELIEYLLAQNRIDELIKRAYDQNPANRELRQFIRQLPRGWSFDIDDRYLEPRCLPEGYKVSGQWEIRGSIGHGSMGTVYETERDSQPLAIKVLHAMDALADEQEFCREAQVTRAFPPDAAEHVARVIDSGYDISLRVPWVVMERLHGTSLRARIRSSGRLALQTALDFFAQLATVLEAAHDRHTIHCDIKPENLFLIEEGDETQIKVLDFGIARRHGESSRAVGTPLYAAPEQWRGRVEGAATDLWACGLIVYFMLTGRDFWRSQQVPFLRAEIHLQPIPPASERAREHGVLLPAGFDAWFARCVTLKPSDRFQSAFEAHAALDDLGRQARSDRPAAVHSENLVATIRVDGDPLRGLVHGTAPTSRKRTDVVRRDLPACLHEDGPFTPAATVRALTTVAGQLAELRQAGSNGLLLPSRIFFERVGDGPEVVRLIDLGAEVVIGARDAPDRTATTRMDISSVCYIRPEVLTAYGEAELDDVWTIAMLAYEMLVGVPYTFGLDLADEFALLKAPVPAQARARSQGARLPSGFDEWFARCLGVRVKFPSVLDALVALDRALRPSDAPEASAHDTLDQRDLVKTVVLPEPTGPHPDASLGWSSEVMPVGVSRHTTEGRYVWKDRWAGEMVVVYVPPGEFVQGSDEGEDDEKPPHRCLITRGFYVSLYPVTVAAFERFVTYASHKTDAEREGDALIWRSPGFPQRSDHPVVCVSWADAKAYCRWAGPGLRLLTEAEWEYIARGSDGRRFPWGDEPPAEDALWWSGNSIKSGTCPARSPLVGVSPLGVAGIIGNVAEWTADWYALYSPEWVSEPPRDPFGAQSGTRRVVRGCAWNERELYACRASARRGLAPGDRDNALGFRCALSGPAPASAASGAQRSAPDGR